MEEALACRTIAERGVQLIATAHGRYLGDLLKNPAVSDRVGGVAAVTLGDEEARSRGTQKSILERKGPVTFSTVVEMRERTMWVTHDTEGSVDALLTGRTPTVEVRSRGPDGRNVVVSAAAYDMATGGSARRGGDEDGAWAARLGDTGVTDKDNGGGGRRTGGAAARQASVPSRRR